MWMSMSANCFGNAPSMGCVAGSDSVVEASLFVSWDDSARGGDGGGGDLCDSRTGWCAGGGGGRLGMGKSLCAI